MINVCNVFKTIKQKTILQNISFHVKAGECVALIGKNGAGKTTLLECLIGDKHLSSGSIKMMGYAPTDECVKTFLAMLLQENTMYPRLKVYEMIAFFQAVYTDSLTNQEIDALLQFSDKQKVQFVSQLSGGQRRLLAFVLTLIGKPKILLLDEPTAFMDTSTRQRFWKIVCHLKKQGVTMIYSSHYIEEVEQSADRILVLHNGKLIEDTSPYALRHQKREKQFIIPVQYHHIIANVQHVSNLQVRQDSIVFLTKNPKDIWQRLMQVDCPIEDIDMMNKTLLNILFEQTQEDDYHESTI